MRLNPRHWIPLLIICSLSAAPSCTNATQRHQATVASTGLYAAIATIDDTERALSTVGIETGNCVTSGGAPCVTKEQHAALGPDILTLLKAGKAANDAVIIAGAVPSSLQDTVNALASLAKRVTNMFPDGATKSKLQTAIIGAQTAATLLLAFRTTAIGANHAREPEHRLTLGPGRQGDRPDRGDRVLAFRSRPAGERHRCGQCAA